MKELKMLRMLKFFFREPYREVHLRRLAKEIRLSPSAAKKYADFLLKKGLIKESRNANLRVFRADTGNLFFRKLKSAFSINDIMGSGFVDFLRANIPGLSSVILFGSVAKGEDDSKSDIDILVIGIRKHLDLGVFERKLGRDINMHVFKWSEWVEQSKDNKAFYADVILTGIPLYGEVPMSWK